MFQQNLLLSFKWQKKPRKYKGALSYFLEETALSYLNVFLLFFLQQIDCNYTTSSSTRPDLHRHRLSTHDPMSGAMCACSYCKDHYRSDGYSPTSTSRHHHDMPPLPLSSSSHKHHMDGASSASSLPPSTTSSSSNRSLNNGLHSPPLSVSISTSSSLQPPQRRSSSGGAVVSPRRQSTPSSPVDEDDDDDALIIDSSSKRRNTSSPQQQQQLTTFKMKLPDLRKGGNQIQISLEVGDIVYEGVICANLSPVSNNSSMEGEHKDQ